MGVKGLWPIALPARTRHELISVLLPKSSEQAKKRPLYRLGVDASLWIIQCQQSFTRGHAQAGENPELRTLFFKVSYFFRLPVTVVFVFDGARRPPMKRNTNVINIDHWMVTGMKEICNAFGFQCFEAEGEAEAELAAMNQLGIVDAVVTDDSDILAFGALTVIRNPSFKRDKGFVDIYTPRNFTGNGNVSLSRGTSILIALLSGGDYNPAGIPGFGSRIAHGLALYGFGDSLLDAALHLDEQRLMYFLGEWRRTLRDRLRTDPDGHLKRCYAGLAAKIHNDFPDVRILQLYAQPAVSPPGSYTALISHAYNADLPGLARICEHYFSWGHAEGISRKFRSLVWPGSVMRSFLSAMPIAFEGLDTPSSFFNGLKSRSHSGHKQYRVKVGTDTLKAQTLSSILRLRTSQSRAKACPRSLVVWIPDHILSGIREQVQLTRDRTRAISQTTGHSQLRSRRRHRGGTVSMGINTLRHGLDYAAIDLTVGTVDALSASLGPIAPQRNSHRVVIDLTGDSPSESLVCTDLGVIDLTV